MKVLIGMTCYNRSALTKTTLDALLANTDPGQFQLYIVNDGSSDDTSKMLKAYRWPKEVDVTTHIHILPCGCPASLNHILHSARQPGQDFIKLDNDLITPPGWLDAFLSLADKYNDVGVIGPIWQGMNEAYLSARVRHTDDAFDLRTLPGHLAWHRGSLLDQIGYFDCLGPGHRYGFEDHLICLRAQKVGMRTIAARNVVIEHLQGTMGDAKDYTLGSEGTKRSHVEVWRPAYEERCRGYATGESSVYVDHLGRPARRV